MQLPRPVIQQFIRPGEPITADFLNQMVGLAGYFQGKPVDAVVPGENIFVGRPAFMQIVSVSVSGTSLIPGWEKAIGRIYTLYNASISNGSDGAFNAISYDPTTNNGICITEINGGNFAEIGDYVMAYPMQTPSGQVFAFVGTRSRLYRVSTPTVIIADQKWSYTLVPQNCGPDGVTWGDDTYGQTLVDAMNEAEALNESFVIGSPLSYLQGNDIDFSLAPFGTGTGTLAQKLQPIKQKRMVSITRFTTTSTGTKIAWFNAPNIVQEGCQ